MLFLSLLNLHTKSLGLAMVKQAKEAVKASILSWQVAKVSSNLVLKASKLEYMTVLVSLKLPSLIFSYYFIC